VKPAVFLDRDGTLVELVHHLTDPADLRVLPGAAESLNALHEHGYTCVVVTNQSAIGRGMMTIDRLGEVHCEFERQLALQGAHVDAHYFCPVAPTVKDPTVIEHPDRKPGPGLLLRAAREHDLDLERSWMVGDTISDLLAGRNAGCRASILVRTGYGAGLDATNYADHIADDISGATEIILRNGLAPLGSDEETT
jgi:D-glycero-D-manno-heptose 1,7-bisphosphate phosphatase